MNLTVDEQRLLAEFRKLTPSGRDELLAAAAALLRRAGGVEPEESGAASNQCRLTPRAARPEADKTPIFTE